MGKIKTMRFINSKKGYSYHTGIALGDKIATEKRGYLIVPEGNQLLEGKFLPI
jgi:hypothetical protein